MPTKDYKIAITLGDPCSIGSEIVQKALNQIDLPMENFILIGNKKMYGDTPDDVEFIDIKAKNLETGRPSIESGEVAFNSIQKAIELVKEDKINAIVTAPISKYAINLAGHNYSGHTEIFDKFLSNGNAQMLFITDDLRVLLLTRHVPLKEIPKLITQELIEKEVSLLAIELEKLGIQNPKLAICGLNPHAGEDGLLGTEEKEIIIPAIKNLQSQGINIDGPYPADMLFSKASKTYRKREKQPYDCYISPFHDQGLCAIKSIDIDNTVNTTLGLEVLRTSPAHGTAFDIAGKNLANSQSMEEAIKCAYNFVNKYAP